MASFSHPRRSFTVKHKLAVLAEFRASGNLILVARTHKIDPRSLRYWISKEHLLEEAAAAKQLKKKLHPGGITALSEECEKELVEWIEEERRAITNSMVCAMAREIGGRYGISREQFTASDGWLTRFKHRWGFSYRVATGASQHLPSEHLSLIYQFRLHIAQLRTQHPYDKSMIFNMDQTMVRFDMPHQRTVEKLGSRSVHLKTTGNSKKGFTVALCASATGGKLPAIIIFKERMGSIPEGVK